MTDTISQKALEAAARAVIRLGGAHLQLSDAERDAYVDDIMSTSAGVRALGEAHAYVSAFLKVAEAEGYTLVRTSIISGDAERESHCDTGHNDEEIFSEGGSLMK